MQMNSNTNKDNCWHVGMKTNLYLELSIVQTMQFCKVISGSQYPYYFYSNL